MLVSDHSELSDEEFESQFESFRLKPRLFTHEAHLRLAYIHIKKYGAFQAEKNICEQIKGYADSLGATDKFNKTVTVAAIKVMNHFMNKSNSNDFEGLIQEYPRLLTHFKELLSKHYGFNVFADKRAKKEYVEPDLLPFT